jgi:hypothetical protein
MYFEIRKKEKKQKSPNPNRPTRGPSIPSRTTGSLPPSRRHLLCFSLSLLSSLPSLCSLSRSRKQATGRALPPYRAQPRAQAGPPRRPRATGRARPPRASA